MEVRTGEWIDINGTSLQGYIIIPYETIAAKLGAPTYVECDPYAKVNWEWVLKFEDDHEEPVIATIYNWKTGHWATRPEQIDEWHIGGHTPKAVELVRTLLAKVYAAAA